MNNEFRVGYAGKIWSGGAFKSNKDTPAEAAAEQFANAPAMPYGDKPERAMVTGIINGRMKGYTFELVGDGSKPEGWKLISESP